jgi:hypothetical protein
MDKGRERQLPNLFVPADIKLRATMIKQGRWSIGLAFL